MKRTLTTLSLFIFLLNTITSQTAHPFELGFNGGAAWLKSDVKMSKPGAGFGFTFGQTYCMNKTSPLLWGWRLRYLNANTYGQDYRRSYGIANNGVLNGDRDTLLDYYHNDGYVYQNYKTHIDELSVEILIGANKIRERTNLYPYIFGGAGITKAVAKTDQLDENSKRYNYSQIDSTGSKSVVRGELNNMNDGTYETLADGNTSPRWKFMPSIGVGLGYEIVKGFSIGIEHKMTWALNDVLDGQRWSGTNGSTGNNDIYHYSSVWIKFSFGRGAKSSSSTTTTNTTDVTNYTNTAVPVPVINFASPSSSPFTSSAPQMNVSGTVSNINSISDMTMAINGSPVSGFNYHANTHVFNYAATLQPGANTIVVTATNAAGSVNAATTIIYEEPVVVPQAPPVVTIPYPNPLITTVSVISLSGTVQNIAAKSQMQIILNGSPVKSFNCNPSTNSFNLTIDLIQGANTLVVSASNAVGNDSKSLTVIYKLGAPVHSTTPLPVITMIMPAANPANANTPVVPITAKVLNVASVAQISVMENGFPVALSAANYNPGVHQLKFNTHLVEGANTIIISAVNSSGSDSKTQTIIYTEPHAAELEPAPVVTITNPSANPANTTVSTAVVNATVLNVSSPAQMSATFNGTPVSIGTGNYNFATHQLSFNVFLVAGINSVVISATNSSGSDSKTGTIIYSQPAIVRPPVVTITNPTANPFNTTTNTANINASVQNITAVGQISVTVNGGPLPTSALNYNTTSSQLAFGVSLIEGANSIVVSATNIDGSDSKTETIIYKVPVVILPPVVTITSPSANPFNTPASTAAVTANIQNITSAAQISVMQNGSPLSAGALNYNSASHQLTFNANLVTGANSIVVTATNSSGSDSKTETIIYAIPVLTRPPVVTITSPATSPFNSFVAAASITATVVNVTSAGQISVMINGTAYSAFTFNTATSQLSFNASLIAGSNTIIISATNAGGTDSKTQLITYTVPVVVQPPVVTFLNPPSDPGMSTVNNYAVVAKVLNVPGAAHITVTVNGTPFTAFTYQPVSKKVTFTAPLTSKTNTVTITATNTAGTDTKTTTIKFQPEKPVDLSRPDTVVPSTTPPHGTRTHTGTEPSGEITTRDHTGAGAAPQITLVTPSMNSVSTTDAVYAIKVKVTNVTDASGISVKVNGTVFPGVTYDASSGDLTVNAPLNPGLNKVIITATNSTGDKTEVFVVKRN